MRTIRPRYFGFNRYFCLMEMFPPCLKFSWRHAKGHVTRTSPTMEWDFGSIDDDSLSFGVLRIENEQHALLATECQVPAGDEEYPG
jgi:hypothetical protein